MRYILLTVLLLAMAGSAMAATAVDFESTTGYTLAVDGAATLARSTEQAHSGLYSAKMYLPSGEADFAKIKVPYGGKLGNTDGTFWTYVPSSSPEDLSPYMYLIADANGNGIYDFTGGNDGDAIVIAFVTGSASVQQDQWFLDGLNGGTKVHVVGNRIGIAPGTFSSSGTQGTLDELRALTFGGSAKWGDLNLLEVRVGAGEWPSVGAFTAYVDDINIFPTPVPTIIVTPYLRTNPYGSPNDGAMMANALYAIEHGLLSYGNPALPTYFGMAISPMDVRQCFATGGPSWHGIADPAPPFNNESGSLLAWGVHVLGNGTKIKVEDLTCTAMESPLGSYFDLAFGTYGGGYYDGQLTGPYTPYYFSYNPQCYGIDYGADGIKGTGDDVLITSGSRAQLVDEIVYRGVRSGYEFYFDPTPPSHQDQIDAEAVRIWDGRSGFVMTTEVALGSARISRSVVFGTPVNILSLIPTAQSIYIRPGESILVDMDVSALQQYVNACQAILGYSSTYFANPTGTAVQVPGSGAWDQVIWDSWVDSTGVPGEIDTAIGVNAQGAVGTNVDGTVCKITLTSRAGVEGVTQMVFRPDVSDIESTFLSDMSAQPVWPAKVNSTDIYIDGTTPADFAVAVDPTCATTSTTLTFSTTDALSGIDYYELFVDSASKGTVASPYVLNLSSYGDGAHSIVVRAFDRAGNYKDSATASVSKDTTAPTINSASVTPSCAKGTVTISASATDTGCAGGSLTYQYSIDAAPAVTFTSPVVVDISGLADGDHSVVVTVTDGNNNTATSSSLPFSKDATAPTINSASVTPSCAKDSVTISASATDAGCAGGSLTYQYSIDAAPAVTFTSPVAVDITSLAQGSHDVVVTVTDGNDNTATSSTLSFSRDSVAPTIDSASVTPSCAKDTVTISAAATDTGCAGGSLTYQYSIDAAPAVTFTSPVGVGISALADGPHSVVVTVTDGNGNTATSSSLPFSKDATGPVISSVTATQTGADVLCPSVAIQGVVDIYVSATDVGCAGMTTPSVAVADIGAASYIGGTAPYHYQVTVLSTTANGSHTITVTSADGLGNTTVDSSNAICVDKNQVTGTVSFGTLSSASYAFSRDVVFTATNAGGTVLKTWTISVSFTNAAATASGSYTLTQVPGGIANLSAKTAYSLRKRQAVALDGNGQAAAGFTLLGGDLNATNSINVLDYSILKVNWMSVPGAVPAKADINGDGQVQTLDYSIMKDNWFKAGDSP